MESASWRIIKTALCHQLLTKFQLPHEFVRWLHLPLHRQSCFGTEAQQTLSEDPFERGLPVLGATDWNDYLSQHGIHGITLHICSLCSRITGWELPTLSSVPPLCNGIVNNTSRAVQACEFTVRENSMNGFFCIDFLEPVVAPERMGHSTQLGE